MVLAIQTGGGSTQDWVHTGAALGKRAYVAGQAGSYAYSSANFVVNQLWAVPLWFPAGRTAAEIWIPCRTNGAFNVRVGMYACTSDTNDYPGALLAAPAAIDWSVAGGASPAVRVASISVNLSSASKVYLAAVADGAAATYMIRNYAWDPCMGVDATTFLGGPQPSAWLAAFVYAALPDPYPAGAAITNTAPPAVAVYYAS